MPTVESENLREWAGAVVEHAYWYQTTAYLRFAASGFELLLKVSSFDFADARTVLVGQYRRGAKRELVLEDLKAASDELKAAID